MAWFGVITNAGKAALAQSISEEKVLDLDEVKLGTGVYTEAEMYNATAVSGYCGTGELGTKRGIESGVQVIANIYALPTAQTVKQLGIYGTIDNVSVLIALYQNESGVEVPSISQFRDFAYALSAVWDIDNTENLTITVSESACVPYPVCNVFREEIAIDLDKKVDKIPGKGLSTEDFTTAEKTKLSGIETNANRYVLPTASENVLGGVKVGANLSISNGVLSANTSIASQSTLGVVKIGSGINVDVNGVISNGYTLPTASAGTLGGVKVGTNLSISNGVLSAVIPTASSSALGGVKVGTNLSISDGVLSAVVPTASASDLGGVKVGSGLSIDTNGVLSNSYSLPTASASTLGGVKVGTNLSISDGVLSATIPTASASALGGVKVGTNLSISNGVLSAVVPMASAGTLGGVKVGSGLSINSSGVLSNTYSYTLPTASASTLGGVKVGSNLSISNGVLSAVLPTASAGTLGCVKVGSGLAINSSGVLSNTYSYTLPTASASTLGGVKVGSGLGISNGVLYNAYSYTLPTASSSTLGGVKVGSGLSINNGVLSVPGGPDYIGFYRGNGIGSSEVDPNVYKRKITLPFTPARVIIFSPGAKNQDSTLVVSGSYNVGTACTSVTFAVGENYVNIDSRSYITVTSEADIDTYFRTRKGGAAITSGGFYVAFSAKTTSVLWETNRTGSFYMFYAWRTDPVA